MNFIYHKKKDSTRPMRVLCAIVFIVFSFIYLYDFQDDLLSVAQHVWSSGQTHYNRTVGAIIITIVLQMLQYGIYSITKLHRRSHALSYLPSFLLLMVISYITPDIDKHSSFMTWLWLAPVILVIWYGAVWAAKQFEPYEPEMNDKGYLSRLMWVNMIEIIIMMFVVCLVCGSNDTFRYRMKLENYIISKDYNKAIKVGIGQAKTDSSLTMLRIYALAHEGRLGDHLFEYPLVGGSHAMLPNGTSVKCMMYSTDSLYSFFGAKPKEVLEPKAYFDLMIKKGYPSRQLYDYIICADLMDKNLDAFVKDIRKYYKIGINIPKHYREALTIYTHLRANPVIVYHDNIMDADFQDLQDLIKKNPDLRLRKNAIKDTYSNTYWYYYMYGSK